MPDLKLIFPSGFYYACESCGECCRREWQIPPESDEKAAELERFARRELGLEGEVLVDEPKSGKKILNIRPRGQGCVFLDGNNLCRVHALLGAGAKPLMCQTFPFKPVAFGSEGRYYVRFSFACPAVRKNKGVPVAEYSDAVRSYIERGVVAGELKDFPVWFAAPRSLEDTPVLIDEETLSYLTEKVIFPDMDANGINGKFFRKIWRLLLNIAMTSSEKGENLVSKSTIDDVARLIDSDTGEVVKDGKSSVVQGEEESGPPSIIRPGIFENNNSKRNLYYAIFAGYEFVGREDTSSAFVKLSNLFKLIRGRGILSTKYGKVDLGRALGDVKFITDDKSAELLRRYFKHITESGWLLIKPDDGLWIPTVVNSWSLLALFYGLITRFARIFASVDKQRDATTFNDIDRAVSMVEVEYVSHISRSWLFLDKRVFAKIFSALASNPDFVPVILSDED